MGSSWWSMGKNKNIENDFIGTSYSWDTQGEASGENVKIRILRFPHHLSILNRFNYYLQRQLLFISKSVAFYDVDSVNSVIVAVGSYGTNNQPLIVSYDTSGSFKIRNYIICFNG